MNMCTSSTYDDEGRLSQYGQTENKQDYVDTRTHETRPHRLFIMEVRFILFVSYLCGGGDQSNGDTGNNPSNQYEEVRWRCR